MKQIISLGIDPLLMMLERRLQGIVICSLPMHGPAFHHMPRLAPMEERYTVYGLADDVKASVSSMAEFDIIEEAAHLFERSSGNQLHRDPVKGKCKVLALGRWRNTLQQEDIILVNRAFKKREKGSGKGKRSTFETYVRSRALSGSREK